MSAIHHSCSEFKKTRGISFVFVSLDLCSFSTKLYCCLAAFKMKLISLALLVLINLALSASEEITTQLPVQMTTELPSEETTTKLPVPDWESPDLKLENEQIIKEREESEQILIDNVAYRGDVIKDYQIGLRQMNLLMRENYKVMIDRVGHNVYPLIVATDVDHDKRQSGVGSEYILFLRNGTIRHMKPTPVQYEQNKNLAHLPMNIFTIISPFFKNPKSPMWQDKLKQLQGVISTNLQMLSSISSTEGRPWISSVFCDENLTFDDHKSMLSLALDYINRCFNSKSVDIIGYKNFTEHYLPYTAKALTCASQIQSKAAMIELKKWRSSLGAKEWREVYVIIPVIWPVARMNPRQLIFEQLLDKDRIKTHIIKAEGAMSIEEARTTSGRVIADRTMAHFVFGYKKPEHVDFNLALSTRRDLVASKAQEYLNSNARIIKFSKLQPYNKQSTVQEVEEVEEVDPNNIHFQNDY